MHAIVEFSLVEHEIQVAADPAIADGIENTHLDLRVRINPRVFHIASAVIDIVDLYPNLDAPVHVVSPVPANLPRLQCRALFFDRQKIRSVIIW